MKNKTLQIQQLSTKMKYFFNVSRVAPPQTGWIKTIRTSLGMSLQQLGNKLNITKQSALDLERREQDGTVTIRALRQAAKALDMQLVYGFVPNDGNLEDLIERKAILLAKQIVFRTSNNMKLEDQENSKQRIEKAINERKIEIINEMPKALWD